jgi:pterin-4a-carbinolamine dehydratase
MKTLLLTTATVLALSSFSASANHHGLHSASYNWNNVKVATSKAPTGYKAMLKSAKAEQKSAAKVGFEWKGIGGFLKKAAKAYKTGDSKTAIALVTKAKNQAILGQRQAQDQANAGPRF